VTRHQWTPEEIEARDHFLRAVAFGMLVLFAAACFGVGLWALLIRGSFTGWLCLCAAAVCAFLALDVGLDLEDR
jgi:hypothetical protein